VERPGRQRQQERRLGGEILADRGRALVDVAGVLGGISLRQPGVQFRQGGGPRDRDEPAAAEPADLALDPALLVRAFLARDAVERLEAGLP